MFRYLFVWDRKTDSYPLRYWVTDEPEGKAPKELDDLDGTLSTAESESALDELSGKYPEPRYEVSRMYASSWQFVEDNFPGMVR